MNASGKEIIKTLCQACLYSCGIEVQVEGGKVTKIEGMAEHPVNKGRLCPKGASTIHWIYSPDRLKFPLKRDNGEWKRISWDEALDTIPSKLKKIKEEHGAKAVVSLFGMVFFVQGRISKELMQRFWDVYGSPNIFSVDSMCYRVRCAAQAMTFGGRVVPDLEIASTNCLVFWAHNPHASQPPLAWRFTPKNLEGKKIIVIDPRKTLIAEKADIHLKPRAGTDCALALGIRFPAETSPVRSAPMTTGFRPSARMSVPGACAALLVTGCVSTLDIKSDEDLRKAIPDPVRVLTVERVEYELTTYYTEDSVLCGTGTMLTDAGPVSCDGAIPFSRIVYIQGTQ